MSSFRPLSSFAPPMRTSTIHPPGGFRTIQPMVPIQMGQVSAPYIPVRQIIVEAPAAKSEEDDVHYRRLEEELDVWRRKYFALETIHQRCSGYEDRLESMEGRIKILREDNRRLNAALKDKINEFEQQRVNFYEVEIENHNLKMAKLQAQRANELLSQRTDELEECRRRCSQLEIQLSSLASFEITLKEYENRIALLNQEMELWKKRYADLDADRIKGIEEWKRGNDALKNSQFEDLRKSGDLQKSSFMNEINNLRAQVSRLTSENDELRRKIQDLEVLSYDWITKKQELEARLAQIKTLNERLNGLISDKTKENEQLKIKVSRTIQAAVTE